jgi:hypothetical protein
MKITEAEQSDLDEAQIDRIAAQLEDEEQQQITAYARESEFWPGTALPATPQ